MIAVLTWWTWYEREIALKSAENICENISYNYDYYLLPDQIYEFLENYKKYDFVIPVFHWEFWEDGKIFWLLESLNIPHAFSGFDTHVFWMNKFLSINLVDNMNIKTPKSYLIKTPKEITNIDIGFPMIVKPNKWWSSIWTSIVIDNKSLEDTVWKILTDYEDDALIQELINWQEYSVSLVWKKEPEVLPVMKLELKNSDLFDYNEKYNSTHENEIFWEEDKKLSKELTSISKRIFKKFNCSWCARIDYIVTTEWIYFLEINTIPGLTKNSILSKAWTLTWRSTNYLIEEIIKNS